MGKKTNQTNNQKIPKYYKKRWNWSFGIAVWFHYERQS